MASSLLKKLRIELAHPRTSIQLCLVGIIAGLIASFLIILFRLGYQQLQSIFLFHYDDFTTLPALDRFLLPVGAATCIVAIAWITGFKHYRLGIPFVIHRVKSAYGLMPFRTTVNQFFGGMLALASGFSVGREGPAVHLGAAGSSLVGDYLKLPFNSIRILAGCGVAAGISASFNTPFAAVIFVMEVVLREYKIHVFIPVMLAAAVGSLSTSLVFGQVHEMEMLRWTPLDPWMYLSLIFFGILMGAVAAFFNHQLMRIIKLFRPLGMVSRLMLAGVITGGIGYLLPQALGSGLAAIDVVVLQPDNFGLLALLLLTKLFLTLIAIGLGVPGGLIGPVFGLGVIAGALFLMPMGLFLDEIDTYTSSFGLLGMAGMLTAVLHAPLAALSAVMELSFNPEVILPAMLVIVPAYVTSTQFLGNKSIFIRQLEYQRLSYTSSSVREALQKTGVLAVMASDYRLFRDTSERYIRQFLEHSPDQLVIKADNFEIGIQYQLVSWDTSLSKEDASPIQLNEMQGVSSQGTLAEVYEILQATRSGAVYIYDTSPDEIIGVITWSVLRQHLHKQEY